MKSRSKGIAFSYVYLIVNMICGLFMSSYLRDTLGDTEYGVYKTVASFANYLILLEFGTGTVMTRNISMCRGIDDSKERINQNVSTIWTIANILSAIIATISIVMYFSIGTIYKNSLSPEQITAAKNIFIFVIIHLLLSFYIQTINGIILGHEKYSYGAILKIIRTVSRTALLATLIFFWKFSIIIAIIDASIALIELIFTYCYCKKHFDLSINFKHFNVNIFKNTLPLSLALFLQTIINQANNNVDVFLIGYFTTPEDVTYYSISLFIFSVFSSMCTAPVSMYAPQIAKDLSGGMSISDLTKKMASASKLTALIGGSILFGFIAVGKPFITLLYGEQYLKQNVWIISIILMIPSFLTMLLGVVVNVLDVLGKRIIRSFALMGTTVANILLSIWWINIWGPIGAACATFVCVMIGQVLVMSIYYRKVIKINVLYLYGQCFKVIIPCQIVSAAAGYGVSSLIPSTSTIYSVLAFLGGGATYVLVFISLYFIFDKDAKKLAKSITKKIRGKTDNKIVESAAPNKIEQ